MTQCLIDEISIEIKTIWCSVKFRNLERQYTLKLCLKREKSVLFSGKICLFMAVILSKSKVLVRFSQNLRCLLHFLKNVLLQLRFSVCIRNKCKNKRQKQNIKHILVIVHLLEVLKDHNNSFSNIKNLCNRIFIIIYIINQNYKLGSGKCLRNLPKALDKSPILHPKYKRLQLDRVGLIGTKARKEN